MGLDPPDGALARAALAQDEADYPALPARAFRSGQAVMVRLHRLRTDEQFDCGVECGRNPVALGRVVRYNGLTLTKASEISAGKTDGWLATGEEVEAQCWPR